MGNWLGQWLGKWFGSGEPAPAGSLYGSATLAVSASGTARALGHLSGAASVSLSASGSAIGAGGAANVRVTWLQFDSLANPVDIRWASGLASLYTTASGEVTGAGRITGAGNLSVNTYGAGYLARNAAGEASVLLLSSGQLKGVGLLHGAANTSLVADGTIAAVGRLLGNAGLLLDSTGSIVGARWATGSSSVNLALQGQLSGALNAYGSASITLNTTAELEAFAAIIGTAYISLTARYFDLKKHEQTFARSILSRTFSHEETENIVAFSKQHSLSVLDAVACVTANAGAKDLFVVPSVAPKSLDETHAPRVLRNQDKKPLAMREVSKPLFVIDREVSHRVTTEVGNIIVTAAPSTMFVAGKPKRQALKSTL